MASSPSTSSSHFDLHLAVQQYYGGIDGKKFERDPKKIKLAEEIETEVTLLAKRALEEFTQGKQEAIVEEKDCKCASTQKEVEWIVSTLEEQLHEKLKLNSMQYQPVGSGEVRIFKTAWVITHVKGR